jgi:conjugal transfer/type IV secretion protein DotA/TraY
MNNKIVKITVGTLLFGLASYAAAQSGDTGAETSALFTAEMQRISSGDFNTDSTAMTIFKELFGGWVDKTDDSLTLLMIIISGIASLSAFGGVILLSFLFVSGVATSAMSGEPMIGDKKVATWYIARIAVAYALILPSVNGISPFHMFFGQTLIPASSAAGDAAAEVVRKYMLSGSTVANLNISQGYTDQKKLLQALICMYDVEVITDTEDHEYYMSFSTSHLVENGGNFGGDETRTKSVLQVGDKNPAKGLVVEGMDYNKLEKIHFGYNGNCGTWDLGSSLDKPSERGSVRSKLDDAMAVAGRRSAIEFFIKEVIPKTAQAAESYVKNARAESHAGYPPQGPGHHDLIHNSKWGDPERTNMNTWLFKYNEVVEGYYRKLYTAIKSGIGKDSNVSSLYSQLVQERDWVKLGYHFHDLRLIENTALAIYFDYIGGVDPKNYKGDCSFIDKIRKSDKCYGPTQAERADVLFSGIVKMHTESNSGGEDHAMYVKTHSCAGEKCSPVVTSAGLANLFTGLLSMDFLPTDNMTGNSGGIWDETGTVTIEGIAENMGANLLAIQVMLTIVSLGLTYWAGVVGSPLYNLMTGGGSGGAGAVLEEIGSRVHELTRIVFAQTFFLKYWIPMMPVITWIIMVVGYFILAIEVMIAAPLALLLMLMPEGEGISGTRMERFIGLIVGLLMRPILLVAGLVAYLTFNGIATKYLLIPIWDILNQMASMTFGVVAIIAIFISVMWQMQNMLLLLISSLPGYVAELVTSFRRDYGESQAISKIASSGENYKEDSGTGVMSGLGGSARGSADNRQRNTTEARGNNQNAGANSNE